MHTLHLREFRGFDNFEIEFKPGVNLLVGDNASGKTTVLKATKYALSSFFSGFSDDNTSWQAPGNEDFRRHVSDDWEAPFQPLTISFSLSGAVAIPSHLPVGMLLHVQKKSPKNCRNLIGGLIPLRDAGRRLMVGMYHGYGQERERMLPLPLFDSISTVFTHTGRKINPDKFLSLSPRATLGYLGCLTGGGFAAHWWRRMKVLAETRTRPWELEGVLTAIMAALGPEGCGIFSDVRPVVSLNEIFLKTTDGTLLTYDILPDGYLRPLDIVVNLAFRALLLNGELYHADAPRLTHGTVLIDEIDLHLHPSLQASIIGGLRNAFPNLQFIMSTHAPRVMGSIENTSDNQVLRLSREDGRTIARPISTYGLDVNTIFGLLNLTTRDPEIQADIIRIFDLIDEQRTEEARTLIDQLRSRFGDTLPDLTEAETMLALDSDCPPYGED